MAALSDYLPLLLRGAVVTVQISVLSYLLALALVTLADILGAARTFNARHYLAVEGLLVAAVLYAALTFTLIGVFALIERRYMAYLGSNR
jgi:ABC-type amino acid transport system permease subunit